MSDFIQMYLYVFAITTTSERLLSTSGNTSTHIFETKQSEHTGFLTQSSLMIFRMDVEIWASNRATLRMQQDSKAEAQISFKSFCFSDVLRLIKL